MKKVRAEYLTRRGGERNRRLVLVAGMTAASLLLLRAIPAFSGDADGNLSAVQAVSGRETAGKVAVAGGDSERGELPAASEMVKAVVANELTDREQLLKWICLIEKRAGKETLTEEQVETRDGPLFRLLAIDGTALTPGQREEDDARIGRLMKDPSSLQKLKQAQGDDELKLQKMLSLMPDSFLYEYDGAEGSLVRVKFRPNPQYTAPTYEARVIHSLAGTILIDPARKRMRKIACSMVNRVEFGYGLLGRIDNGTVELERVEVGTLQWKTAFINIHFSGRVAVFKSISKDQYERRSDFREVASDLSLADGKELLLSRRAGIPAAALH